MRTVDQYVLRVLADRWAAPVRTPSLRDVSRRGDGIAAEPERVGFRVTRITLADSSLETVSERLARLTRHFDAVVCRDVLDHVDDWDEVVGRAARRLKPGGVFVYGLSECTTGRLVGRVGRVVPRWIRFRLRPRVSAGEVVAALHRIAHPPREMISLGAETLGARATAYMGHSIRAANIPAARIRMRRDFTGTGEHWIAGVRGYWVSRASG